MPEGPGRQGPGAMPVGRAGLAGERLPSGGAWMDRITGARDCAEVLGHKLRHEINRSSPGALGPGRGAASDKSYPGATAAVRRAGSHARAQARARVPVGHEGQLASGWAAFQGSGLRHPWSKFIFMLSYKAQSAGRKLIKVDPRNTTQRCSACGSRVKKDLSVRVHECPYCGFSCNRDYNASRNILITGMEQPVEPIEPKPLRHISVMQVLAMKWEAAPFRA